MRGSDGQDRSVTEIDLKEGGAFNISQTTIGDNEAPKYGSDGPTPLDWEKEGVISRPDIVKTSDSHAL